MFCVITADALPRFTSVATARWPRFGSALRIVASVAKRRRHVSRRASSEARNSEKSIGFIRVQMPPGLRKSGMPDSVLIPAPVKKTIRCASSIIRRSSAMSGSIVPAPLACMVHQPRVRRNSSGSRAVKVLPLPTVGATITYDADIAGSAHA